MRIFYVSDTTPHPDFQSNLWRSNLLLPLVDLGHDVVEFRGDLRRTFQHLDTQDSDNRAFIARNRPRLTARLLRQVRAAHAAKPVDLFFSYFYDACVEPQAIDEIRALGITTVNWYCNGSYQLHLVSQIAPHYDWCLVPEKFRLRDYDALGAHPIYCQEAANPAIYRPYDLPAAYDVTFVGQNYGERPGAIQYLRERGIDVRVWGYGWGHGGPADEHGWRRWGRRARGAFSRRGLDAVRRRLRRRSVPGAPPEADAVRLPPEIVGGLLTDSEMIQMYSRSKINLGFSACGETHRTGQRILQVRLRDFEVPMSGGFYMVEYMEELEEFYEIGKEIVCYSGVEDLAEKIRYYLTHDEEREKIRQAGRRRCLRDHTWQKRFQTSFQQMGMA